MTHRMNEFRQKFEKLYHFQIWLSEQNIAIYHTSLYHFIKYYNNIVLFLQVMWWGICWLYWHSLLVVRYVNANTINKYLTISREFTSHNHLLSIFGIFPFPLHDHISYSITYPWHNKWMDSDKNSKSCIIFTYDSRSKILWHTTPHHTIS